jgi:hypothetical protein
VPVRTDRCAGNILKGARCLAEATPAPGGRAHGKGGWTPGCLSEQFYEAAIVAAQGPSTEESAAETREMIRAIIASRGVEQKPSESLFETFARALGVSSRELRADFMQRAMGRISPP